MKTAVPDQTNGSSSPAHISDSNQVIFMDEG